MRLINLFVLLSFLVAANISAQWSTDNGNNLQVTDWNRLPLSAASDGDGGVYIAINQAVSGNDTIPEVHSFLFKLDKYGYSQWSEPIHIGLEDWQHDVKLMSDGFGGVIACIMDLDFVRWNALRMIWDYKISLQRIDSLGNKLWGDGIYVCTDTTDQYAFDICTDGNGGCYVSWLSEKTMDYTYSDGYRAIQHISAEGERMWSDTGKILFKGGVNQYAEFWYQLKPNSDGGIYTIHTPNLNDFHYMNIDTDGNIIWEKKSRFDSFHREMYAGSQHGIIAFTSKRDSTLEFMIFEMDRINIDGEYIWDDKKLFTDSVGKRSEIIDLYFNEDSSASIYWMDYSYDTTGKSISYYQLIDENGNLQLAGNGLTSSEEYPDQNWGERMIKSNDDYIIIYIDDQLKARKIKQNGEFEWAENVIFSTMGSSDRRYTTDKRGGFIYVFIKDLIGLRVQQVSTNGNLGEVVTSVKRTDNSYKINYLLEQNYPNPFNPSTTIKYSIPSIGKCETLPTSEVDVKLVVYDVLGREVAVLVNGKQRPGNYEVKFIASHLSSGTYFYRLTSGDYSKTMKFILLK